MAVRDERARDREQRGDVRVHGGGAEQDGGHRCASLGRRGTRRSDGKGAGPGRPREDAEGEAACEKIGNRKEYSSP
ncbi:hypothetical protein Ccel01_18410 [Cellulosimicrobium cellulans]|uniref:Uncharacterized protein n=1 Tax=Cellulosimicrobium cellulans TaxID=1710 RepID=A0AAV5P460_CELCE|nr:hypothetical protein Ccel01_18410 [Cellulosimicrobium cellulans]